MSRIATDSDRIADFCRRHHISSLSFYGSVLRDDFASASDVDVLVEFDECHTPGLEFFSMEVELSAILNRKVDSSTPAFLCAEVRADAMREREFQYVATD